MWSRVGRIIPHFERTFFFHSDYKENIRLFMTKIYHNSTSKTISKFKKCARSKFKGSRMNGVVRNRSDDGYPAENWKYSRIFDCLRFDCDCYPVGIILIFFYLYFSYKQWNSRLFHSGCDRNEKKMLVRL